MADRPLFNVDTEARWRLVYDSNHWVLQRRVGAPRPGKGAAVRDTGWRGVSFIGSEKRILRRVIREAGVLLTAEAQAQLDALPARGSWTSSQRLRASGYWHPPQAARLLLNKKDWVRIDADAGSHSLKPT